MCAPFAMSQRAIPDDNLAYPVLINLTDCSNVTSIQGTGFFMVAKSVVYLVTARHVLFNASVNPAPNQPRPLLCKKGELMSYSKDPKETQMNRFSLDLEALNANGAVQAHSIHDVAVVRVATTMPAISPSANPSPSPSPSPTTLPANASLIKVIPGVMLTQSAPSGILSVSSDVVGKFDDVLTANDIYVLGYPTSIGLQQAPQINYSAPLLRRGIIAGINSNNKTVVLDCMTFHGNSGGPVVEVIHEQFRNRFLIVGIVSQYIPLQETWVNATQNYLNVQYYNSGYSVAEPMDSVLELTAANVP